ncbi:dual specificity protein phosphatase family protein [Halochromatium glycolicum]|jgi:atypical dual specificity phosphatase|uniref:Tyrosine specific protein phosphatases domain-containing protein n=1 Tax=Halochromatium glycolicum TaxID=85075 RepID=A0AAJ0U6D7_9GAMM|nr:dual specificity protein phosphatase family protein [Halochromatium glycolicum]MBK1706140.1 hypothetical protein [Halochromatium glycolicum]
MWSWSLNWAEITPSIVVGTCPMTPDDLERIHHEAGCSAVLSVQHDDCMAYWGIDEAALQARADALGMQRARRPMRDFIVEDQRRHLVNAVCALAAMQAAGQRTYVHCTAGLGRAPLTVWSYLSWVEGMPSEDAVALIKARRAGAVPAPEAHLGCREDLLARYRDAYAAAGGPDWPDPERLDDPAIAQAALRTLLLAEP